MPVKSIAMEEKFQECEQALCGIPMSIFAFTERERERESEFHDYLSQTEVADALNAGHAMLEGINALAV